VTTRQGTLHIAPLSLPILQVLTLFLAFKLPGLSSSPTARPTFLASVFPSPS